MKPRLTTKVILANVALFIMLLACAEVALRTSGYSPYNLNELSTPNITVQPGGRYFQKDRLLGYKNLAGKFTVRLKDTLEFVTTHTKKTHRVTSPVTGDTINDKPEIWFLGCSYTHGWSINDEETFPWLVQSELPDYQIENLGVIGYGTIHFYLQLEEAFSKKQKPEMVVLNHAYFHLGRNMFLFERRRILDRWSFLGPLHQPFAEMNWWGNITISHTDFVYQPWELSRHSSLFRKSQTALENFSDWFNRKHEEKVFEHLLVKIVHLCQQHNVRLLLTNLTKGGYPIETFCQKHHISFVDLSIDLTKKEHTNLPVDGHPSATANIAFAKKLNAFLTAPL